MKCSSHVNISITYDGEIYLEAYALVESKKYREMIVKSLSNIETSNP